MEPKNKRSDTNISEEDFGCQSIFVSGKETSNA